MDRVTKGVLIGLGLLATGVMATLVASTLLLKPPEVTLGLVDPANPGLLLINDTGAEAKDARYEAVLWNVDNLREGYKMLPMPRKGLDRLPPHWRYGPINLFDTAEIRPWLKPGNRIVGNIAVHCRNCARGYTYWVLITWGKGGWFSELKGKKAPSSLPVTTTAMKSCATTISSTPC